MIEDYLSGKQKKKKKRRQYVFAVIAFLVVYLLFLAVGWIVLRSPFFRVDKIVVQGNENVPSADVVTLLQSATLRDHSFVKALLGFHNILIWPSSLQASDLAFDPELASVTLSKSYFSHTITATVVERQPFAIWCLVPSADASTNSFGNEQCYWFDNEGTVFQKTFDTEGSLMFAVHDYSQKSLSLDGTVVPEPFVQNLISIINAIKKSGIDVQEIALNDISLQEIDVTTYNGPAIYFSLRFPADEDEPVLASLMAKPGFNKLQYVDFRVENRAYYK